MATSVVAPVGKPQTCIVCGMQSHRTDWINKSGAFVACDRHTPAEMQAAISRPVVPLGKPGEPVALPKMSSIPPSKAR